MGQSLSARKAEAEKEENETQKKINDGLNLLEEMANNAIDSYAQELKITNTNIPIIDAVAKVQDIHIKKEQKTLDSAITETCDSVVNAIFTGKTNDIQDAMKNSIHTAVNGFLNNVDASGTKNVHKEYYIYMENYSLVKCDCFIYSYSLSSTTVFGENSASVVAYYIQKSIIDLPNTDPNILLYELSQNADALSDDFLEKLQTLGKDAESIMETITSLKKMEFEAKKNALPF